VQKKLPNLSFEVAETEFCHLFFFEILMMKTIAIYLTAVGTIALFPIIPSIYSKLISCRLPSDPPPKEPAGTSL
jgi:hypothetical protein